METTQAERRNEAADAGFPEASGRSTLSRDSISPDIEGSLPNLFLNEAIGVAAKHCIRFRENLLSGVVLGQPDGKGCRPAEWGVNREECWGVLFLLEPADNGIDRLAFEEFRALCRRAFLAPAAKPGEEGVRAISDELAWVLWQRLHRFEERLEAETQRLDEALDEMAQTLPASHDVLLHRQLQVEAIVKEEPYAEHILSACIQDLRQRLGKLMRVRYGPDPQIDRFCQGTEGL